MNKLALTVAVGAVLAAGALAQAADLAVKAAPAPVQVGWTGGYIGLNAGYGWGRSDVLATPGDPNTAAVFAGQTNIPPLAASIDTRGWLGGIQGGYDWQLDSRWLIGVAADFDGAGIKNSTAVPATVIFGTQAATYNASQSVDWFGTLRVRGGFLATPDLLLYGSGGLAYGKVSASASLALPPGQSNSTGNGGFGLACGPFYGLGANCFAGSGSGVSTGWTAGAGGEYRLARNVSVMLEYLHVDLGHRSFVAASTIPAGVPLSPSSLNASASARFDLVRAGVNYRF